MTSVPGRFALVGLIVFACGNSAFGGTYADPSGFSLDYPDGWAPVTQVSMEKANRGLPDEFKTWVSKNNVDLNRIAVVVLRAGRDEFQESINVVVDDQQVPVNDKTAQNLTEQFRKRCEAMNMKVDNVQGRVQRVGLRDAVVMECQLQMPGVPHLLRQKQVLFPGGGKTYIVTCTAKAGSFDTHLPTFDRILASVQVPAPVAQGFDWNQVLMAAVRWGVLGGVAGCLIGALGWFGKKFSGTADRGQLPAGRR